MSQPRLDAEQAGGRDRARVRRQERVGHRQAGEHRHRVQHQRPAAALGGDVDQRREHEDADVEEHRDAEDQAGAGPSRAGAPFSPNSRSSRDVSTSAPPERSRIAPSTVPSPMIERDVAEDAAETLLQDGVASP